MTRIYGRCLEEVMVWNKQLAKRQINVIQIMMQTHPRAVHAAENYIETAEDI